MAKFVRFFITAIIPLGRLLLRKQILTFASWIRMTCWPGFLLAMIRGHEPGGGQEGVIMKLPLINPFKPVVSLSKMQRWNCLKKYRVRKPLGLLILARLTPPDWEVEAIDGNLGPVVELHQRQLGHLGPERLATLVELLEVARGSVSGHCLVSACAVSSCPLTATESGG